MKKIRIGIVGLNFGRYIVQQIAKEQKALFEIAILCDLDTGKAQKTAEENGLTSKS